MDGETIRARVYAGYARAAQRIGLLHDQFRPITASSPLADKVQGLLVAFDTSVEFHFDMPDRFGSSATYALVDDALVESGDYLVREDHTYFVAGKQQLAPVMCIECNRSVAIIRQPAATTPTGAQGYGGICAAEATAAIGTIDANGAVVDGWPCSILLGGRRGNALDLPLAVSNEGFQILLPSSLPIVINAGDVFIDDLGRRYQAQASESSHLGWRINAREVHP